MLTIEQALVEAAREARADSKTPDVFVIGRARFRDVVSSEVFDKVMNGEPVAGPYGEWSRTDPSGGAVEHRSWAQLLATGKLTEGLNG